MTVVKYATLIERKDTNDLFLTPGKRDRSEDWLFDDDLVETERVAIHTLNEPMSKTDAVDWIAENAKDIILDCLPDHYMWRHESWSFPSFGCRHTDQEESIGSAPDFCPFCGISLGGEDIWDREWPNGWDFDNEDVNLTDQ